jgi:uncharacterized membrane protein SpoIIM required for sporulation
VPQPAVRAARRIGCPSARQPLDQGRNVVDLDAYVTEHRGEWQRLGALSRRRTLTAYEADELVLLYQRVATQLSVVRSRTPDPALVAELSQLVLGARSAITGPSRVDWRRVPKFFLEDLPRSYYSSWRWWVTVMITFVAVAAVFIVWVAGDPSVAADFGITDEDARRLVDNDFEAYYSEHVAASFSLQLWTHNAWLALLCLASGVVIFPVIYLLWKNAESIGVVGGVMVGNDAADKFFGLIAPHGLLELTGIFIAAGIGLRIGWSWIAPRGQLSRSQSLAQAAREGMLGALGLIGVFAVSACLEAFVTPSELPLIIRDVIGLVVWLLFQGYVFVLGSRAQQLAEQPSRYPADIGAS